jgi:hypothetical protein
MLYREVPTPRVEISGEILADGSAAVRAVSYKRDPSLRGIWGSANTPSNMSIVNLATIWDFEPSGTGLLC